MAGSVWDEVLDTEHAVVVRTYIEHWPRKDRPAEKVLIIVVEPDEEARPEFDIIRWAWRPGIACDLGSASGRAAGACL